MVRPRLSTKRRLGRPPSGARPGEKVSEYPQISIRVPPEVERLLKALCDATSETQWRVVGRALMTYADKLPPSARSAIAEARDRARRAGWSAGRLPTRERRNGS
jgi:predicted transcriptional regulator